MNTCCSHNIVTITNYVCNILLMALLFRIDHKRFTYMYVILENILIMRIVYILSDKIKPIILN